MQNSNNNNKKSKIVKGIFCRKARKKTTSVENKQKYEPFLGITQLSLFEDGIDFFFRHEHEQKSFQKLVLEIR